MIPSSGPIRASEINKTIRKNKNETIDINSFLPRLITKVNSGVIKFSDFRNKYLVETKALSSDYLYHWGGSNGRTSSWTNWYTTEFFGMISYVKIWMECACVDGNFDQMCGKVQIVNKTDESRSIVKFASWGTGDNWTGTYRSVWELSKKEMDILGGPNSKLKFRMQAYMNKGSHGATNRMKIIVTTR